MLGGFFVAAEAGIFELVFELAVHTDRLSLPMGDAGAAGAFLSGGQDTKTAIIGMLSERLAGMRDTGGPSQGTQAIQRPPAATALLSLRIRRLSIHPHLVHGTVLVWRAREKLLPTGDRKGAPSPFLTRNAPNLAGIAVSRCTKAA